MVHQEEEVKMKLAVVCLSLVLGPAASGELSPQKAEAVERIAAAAMAREHTPGLSVAVLTGDGTIWTRAMGFGDLENFVPVTTRSQFRIGSISKTLTAVAAMDLMEEGKLDLDAEVQRYLPQFPRKEWPVTLRQLMSHTAGIRNYRGEEFNSTRHYANVAQALSIFARDPLQFEPGTKYFYTTYGFNVVGAVVETVAGRPYVDVVRERVLQPSGANGVRIDDVYSIVPFRVRGYQRAEDGAVLNCLLADTSNKLPGGGWVANAEDLAKYARALMDGKLLRRETLDVMWTPQRLKNGSELGYGLGWGVLRKDDVKIVEHSGTQQGIKSHLLLVPEKHLAVVVLTNLEMSRAPEIAYEILAEIVRKEP